jgi:hypothetical protein
VFLDYWKRRHWPGAMAQVYLYLMGRNWGRASSLGTRADYVSGSRQQGVEGPALAVFGKCGWEKMMSR